MKISPFILFFSGMAMMLAGCAADIARPEAGAAPPAAFAYSLAAGDRVRVTVYNEANLTGEYTVSTEGEISFPLVGAVKVEGLSIGAVNDILTRELDARYFKNPHVATDLVASRPIYVLGEVNKAGQYPYQPGMTVLAAVATAGGFTYRANQKVVMVRHSKSAQEERLPLTADLPIYPGDTIRVRERYF